MRIKTVGWRSPWKTSASSVSKSEDNTYYVCYCQSPPKHNINRVLFVFIQSIDQKPEQPRDLLFVRRKGLSKEVGEHIWKYLSMKLLEKSPCSSNRRNICAA